MKLGQGRFFKTTEGGAPSLIPLLFLKLFYLLDELFHKARTCFILVLMSIRKDTIVEVISQVPLFAQLNPREVGFLANAFVPIVFQDGDVIFNIGDISETMFVVYEGQVVLSFEQADDDFLWQAFQEIFW